MFATIILVPLMVGFPWQIFGFTTTRSLSIAYFSLAGFKAMHVLKACRICRVV